jgi:hypothetical protein
MTRRTTLAALVCAMLLLCFAGTVRATDYTISPTWNGYEKVETVGPLIPFSDGTLVGGSNYATADDGFFPIPLPFDFMFLGTLYPGGTSSNNVLWVSITGAAKFGAGGLEPAPLQAGYDLSYQSNGSARELIMPFWGNFFTNSSPPPSCSPCSLGIYRKTMPSSGTSRVLIVEWRVLGKLLDENEGLITFQLLLYEGTSIIEFRYGSPATGAIELLKPSAPSAGQQYGAVIGIKNQGQINPPCPGSQSDEALSLLINPLDNGLPPMSRGQRKLCVSGLSVNIFSECTECSNGTKWAELASTIPTQVPSYSHYFHYKVPANGYTFKPIIADIGGDTNGTGSRVCNVYQRPDTVVIAGTFRNYAADSARNVRVVAQVLRRYSDMPEDSVMVVIDSIPAIGPGRSIVHQFSRSFILPDKMKGFPNNAPDSTYRIRMWCDMPGDRNRLNDTMIYTLIIGGRNDGMACCINSPRLNISGPPFRYLINKPIPLSTGFFNAGMSAPLTLPVRGTIADARGMMVALYKDTLSGMTSGEERTVQFPSWTPTKPGLYYMIASTHLAGDDRPANNELYSYPYATPAFRVPASLPRIPFIVAYAVDMALVAHAPAGSVSVTPGGRVAVAVTLSNNGAYDLRNVVVRARIVRRGTKKPIHDVSTTISRIEAGAQQIAQFHPARIPATGTYDVTFTIAPKGDADKTNNTAATTILCVRSLPPFGRSPVGADTDRRISPSGGAGSR